MKTERAVALALVWALAASFVGCGGPTGTPGAAARPARRLVEDGRLTIAFMEYDWTLNDASASATE